LEEVLQFVRDATICTLDGDPILGAFSDRQVGVAHLL
jgi:hypothetical protein